MLKHGRHKVFNTIMTWSYEQPNLKGLVALNSYRSGVAAGLWHTAKGEKEAQEQRAIEHEKRLIADRVRRETEGRERELQRLRGPSVKEEPAESAAPNSVKVEAVIDIKPEIKPEPMHQGVKLEEVVDEEDVPYRHPDQVDEGHLGRDIFDSDSDNDPLDFDVKIDPDFEEDDDGMEVDVVYPHVKAEEAVESIAVKKEESPPAEQWQSMGQLIRFRKDAQTIADDYLRSTKLKTNKARKRAANQIDGKAYRKGQEDSKKIDVKRRRLEGGAKSEDEI